MASNSIKSGFKRSALTVALGLCFAGTVHAQATTGTVFGNAAPGETITVVSDTGFARTVAVDSSGRYSIGSLPIGNYTVTAKKGDQVVGTKQILVKVSSGTEASFAGAQSGSGNELGTITVTASGAGIDVTQVDSRTVITAKDLAVLPIAHSAEAIALLAPGTVSGSGNFGPAVSFGGAGVTENAYYINGYNVADPLSNIGGLSLPYGSIAQQETYTGGYSAMYGRSDGGVINQVGKRGTKDWHFGGQIMVRPKALASAPKDVYYPKTPLPSGIAGSYPSEADPTATPPFDGNYRWHYDDASLPGTLFRERKDDKRWNTTYSAYVGGPLVPEKLFFFLSAEKSKDSFISTTSNVAAPITREHDNQNDTRIYGKIDWNINDSNILELTGIKSNNNVHGSKYYYDYASHSQGAYYLPTTPTKNNRSVYIAKYTNYLSDNLNFSVTYGKDTIRNPSMLAVQTDKPFIQGANFIPVAKLPAGDTSWKQLTFEQPTNAGASPNSRMETSGVRFDVEYKLGSHQLHGGIDNLTSKAIDQGNPTGVNVVSGPGYWWNYRSNGKNVRQQFRNTLATMSLVQKAIYIEDVWQVTDRFMVKGGLRSDNFNNKNGFGESYVHQKHQLAPRLGFSWDIKGDSTMKLFGNLGRYYLALPNEVAVRGASPSSVYYQNYTYTGVDAYGRPTGLTYVPNPASGCTGAAAASPEACAATGGTPASVNGGWSGNREFGLPVDHNMFASKNLKPQYQDEAILGFDWQFSKKWMAGVKGTYRKLGTVIDDWCDLDRVDAKASKIISGNYGFPGTYCYIVNPGRTNIVRVANLDATGKKTIGYTDISITNEEMGFGSIKPKRIYEALDVYVEHPFDGKWQWRMDYTWSRNPGNTEGQVKSNLGQADVSKTQDWDSADLMQYSYGYMANDRRHSLRMRGMYQFASEWLLTGKLLVQSGVPKDCLGYYFNEADPIGYGSSYHTCFNKVSTPGKERGPWTKQLDLGIVYRPKYFDKKLTVAANVFNITNERKPLQYNSTLETSSNPSHGDGTVLTSYGRPIFFQSPRYVQLSVSYDY